MTAKMVEPFVLKVRVALPPDPEPTETEIYDPHLQLWINTISGGPLVSELSAGLKASNFGETTITETREGADQSELTALHSSQFGETTVTKSHEGADQGESALGSSFGETTHTRSREGADVSESASILENAANTHF